MSAPRRHGTPSARPLAGSLLLHVLALLLLRWGGPRLHHEIPTQIRLVRLTGGGQNRPGWVAESPPAAEEQSPAEAQAQAATPAPAPRETPAVARTPQPRPVDQPSRRAPEPRDMPRPSGEATEAGARRDRGAGARGPGGNRTGATADQPDLAGMGQYLLRVENAIQRAFRYPARGSGRKAVFHFIVERDGRVTSLEQLQSSGLPGLDLSGRSAITRAVLPPLPPAFGPNRIGVTFTFIDE